MKNVNLFFKSSMFMGAILLVSLSGCQKEEISNPNLVLEGIEECVPVQKAKFYIGQEYGGGIIYFIDATGKHGLIVAKEDLGPAPWGCEGTLVPESSDDQQMTKNILAACNEPGIAARLCDEYVVYEKESGKHKDYDKKKEFFRRNESDNHNNFDRNNDKNKGKKYDDWFMPRNIGSFYSIANLTCTRWYWTTIQAIGFQTGPLDPAKFCQIIGTACLDNKVYREYIAVSKKTDVLYPTYVRPVRKF
jgi:hypothetical protein